MKLLVVACFIAAACAYPSNLGSEKCTYGPSYWCENYKQAVECEAIEHCKKFVWKAKGDVCEKCEKAIKKAHTFVTTNSSKVLEILKNMCSELPKLSNTCKFAINTYGTRIIAALEAMTANERKLCQELELCSSTEEVKIIETILIKKLQTHSYILELKSVKGSPTCDRCKLGLSELKSVIENQYIQKEIIGAFETACSKLGAFADECIGDVDKYMPLFFDKLASLDNPIAICIKLGLCSNSTIKDATMKAATIKAAKIKATTMKAATIKAGTVKAEKAIPALLLMPGPVMLTPPEKTNKANAVFCDTCKAEVAKIDFYLRNNASKIRDILRDTCEKLGSKWSCKCKVVNYLFGGFIIRMVESFTADEVKLCQKLGMCPSSEKVKFTKDSVLESIKTHPVLAALRSGKTDYCDDCKLVLAEIKDILTDKDMQQEITNLLETLCEELGSLADECKEYVGAYLPLVLEEVATLIDPTELCTKLGLCSNSTKKIEAMSAFQLLPAYKKKVASPLFMPASVMIPATLTKKAIPATLMKKAEKKAPEVPLNCMLCEFAMKELDGILEDNATQTKIEEALEKVCSILPSTLQASCDEFMRTYGPAILQLLVSEIKPSEVCTILGFCSSSTKKPSKFSFKKIGSPNDINCDLCKMVMKSLDSFLNSNATQTEIEAAFQKICPLLPSFMQPPCKEFVKELTHEVIRQLLEKLQPIESCAQLGYCFSLTKKPAKFSFKKTSSPNNLRCAVCEMVVEYVYGFVESNTTEEKIKEALEKVCTVLPSTLKIECDALVEEYTHQMIEQIIHKETPEKVCEILKLCSGPEKLKLNDECALGESYWCASYKNALKCEALEHCNYIA